MFSKGNWVANYHLSNGYCLDFWFWTDLLDPTDPENLLVVPIVDWIAYIPHGEEEPAIFTQKKCIQYITTVFSMSKLWIYNVFNYMKL